MFQFALVVDYWKKLDLKCFFVPCFNVLPFSTLRQISGLQKKPTSMSMGLVDGSIVYPQRKVEDVILQVDHIKFQVHFIILEIEDESDTKLLLGRLFLVTLKALIDSDLGEL
jgi:hypothetical protein